MSADTLHSLYFALVHPYYEYANIVWAAVLQKLFITQKRAVRIRTNLSWHAHTYPLIRKKDAHLQFRNYVSCRWHVLYLKWIKALRLHTFKCFFCINADVHSYNTRFATNYHITVHWTSLLHYTIRIARPLLWNSLDSNIKSVFCNQFKSFRRKLKNLLLSHLGR